jgi:hypothetical protein
METYGANGGISIGGAGRLGSAMDYESKGMLNASIPQPPLGGIPSQLQEALHQAEVLQKSLAMLEQRLEPVLHQQPTTASGGGNSARPTSPSGLANAIAEVNARLMNAIGHVNSIANRVDL